MKNDSDQLLATRWTLIERLKNWDDQESWRQFFDTYWKLIYGVAIKSGLTHPEAQDVVQETVISVSKSMHNFKADPAYGSFKAWLLNLTRWRITDQFRKRRRGVNAREELPHSGSKSDTTSTAAEERVPDPAGNALEAIWNDEWEKHIVDAALEKVKQQSSGKHYQIFFLQAIKQIRKSSRRSRNTNSERWARLSELAAYRWTAATSRQSRERICHEVTER